MKDVAGKEINIGDTVVTMFDEYAHLTICTVEKISAQKVGLKLKDSMTAAPITALHSQYGLPVRYKYPRQIAKIS